MRYYISDDCTGCGLCAGLCPAVFQVGWDGLCTASEEEISQEDMGPAAEAAYECPEGAILEDEDE